MTITNIRQPTINEMIKELEAAGWARWYGKVSIWQAPNGGGLYRGPYGAWRRMRGAVPMATDNKTRATGERE